MTAGNSGSGANPPENDDPFGYLYRSENGEEGRDSAGSTRSYGQSGPQQPGVPRTSYNQVRAVGERTYGGGQQRYGQEPSPIYAAPETQPGGRPATRRPDEGHGRPRPPRGNGLLIGAIAVVVAVVIGVGAAILLSNEDDEEPEAGSSPTPTQDDQPGENGTPGQASPSNDETELPRADAATFSLGGDPQLDSSVPGAEAANGTYVGMNKPGASAAWTAELPQDGRFRLYIRYGVPGKDMNLSLYVNGEKQDRPINMANFSEAGEGEWDKGWSETWAAVDVNKGDNEFRIACDPGDKCEVNLDQVWIAEDAE